MPKVCNITLTSNCDVCKELSQLLSNLVIAAGLTASTSYYVWVVDKFGNIFRDQYTTNLAGSFTLLEANYPTGMLNPYAGAFEIFVSMDQDGDTIVPMDFGDADEYNCAILRISGC